MEKQLSETQTIILGILEPLHRYLSENKIPYFISGGTLLGAVRHKGFIPWDDDMDIALPRKYYDRLLKELPEQLPEDFRLDTWQNNPEHHFYFAQLVDKRHLMMRTGSKEKRKENVWIDIFPLDGTPKNAIKRQLHRIHFMALRAMYHFSTIDKVNIKRPGRPLLDRIIIRFALITGFGKHTDKKVWLGRIDRLLRKYPYEGALYAGNYMGQYKWKQIMPKACFGKGALYPFESFKLRGPADYDYFLKRIYGDYMKLPENRDKNAHHSELLN